MSEDRQKIQKIVTDKEGILTSIFKECLVQIDADQGFLAFIDPNEHLRVLVQKGEYWYLWVGNSRFRYF